MNNNRVLSAPNVFFLLLCFFLGEEGNMGG